MVACSFLPRACLIVAAMLSSAASGVLAQSRDDSLAVASAVGAQLWEQYGSTGGAISPPYGRVRPRSAGSSAGADSAAHLRIAAAAAAATELGIRWVLREPGPAPVHEPERTLWFESVREFPVVVAFTDISFKGDSAVVTTRTYFVTAGAAGDAILMPGYTERIYQLLKSAGRWFVDCVRVESIVGN